MILLLLLAVTAATPEPQRTPSTIRAVTVYQGQALVTREVTVPDAVGRHELIVGPLPDSVMIDSLDAEGAEGVRVISTRAEIGPVDRRRNDEEIHAQEAEIERIQGDDQRIKAEITLGEHDTQFFERLQNFTGSALGNLSDKGRIDSDAVLAISGYLVRSRAERSRTGTELRQQVERNLKSINAAQTKILVLRNTGNHFDRNAVVVIQKAQPGAAVLRLTYLVAGATWTPQYRMRATSTAATVRLESLATVSQRTGESWPDVALTLSTAQPSIDAAPPELLPLQVEGSQDRAETNAVAVDRDDASRRVAAELDRVIPLPFPTETSISEVLKHIRLATQNTAFPDGLPIFVNRGRLAEDDRSPDKGITLNLPALPLRTGLRLALEQAGLTFRVQDGVIVVLAKDRDDPTGFDQNDDNSNPPMDGSSSGRSGTRMLNRNAAVGQGQELDFLARGESDPGPVGSDSLPGVTVAIRGWVTVPSQASPLLLEVDQADLPAEFLVKAIPVLTPRVYRLAQVTNNSGRVILPGLASVSFDGGFVGQFPLPAVAVGEPFQACFGIDPQVQLGRRLVGKSRTVQGGNQVLAYEFRINVHNRHDTPTRVQLWDRLPMPEGEKVAVQLGKTSTELSTDPLYLRTARHDNLLRWDLVTPAGAAGDRATVITYEFRIETAKDQPIPRFLSGDLGEKPIGGGAMGMAGMGGGMGGMGGGMRSLPPH